MVPCLRLGFSLAFLFFPGQQEALTPNCGCTPGPTTDNELLIKSHFLGNVCLDMLTPPPSCSTSMSEGNEATTRTKRALTPFVPYLLPPSLLAAFPT